MGNPNASSESRWRPGDHPPTVFAWLIVVIFALLPASAAELDIEVVDDSGEPVWARLEVRGRDGKMYQPPSALRDLTAVYFPGIGPWYLGSFVARGKSVVEIPAGSYTVVAERGTEYERFEKQLAVSEHHPVFLKIPLKPWIRMNELGWWSADLHIHRPPEEMPKLALAEDLNLSVVTTIWNKHSLWEEKEWPKDPVIKVSPRHLVTVLNAEDERGGGAWMFHGLLERLDLAAAGRWYPPGIDVIRRVRSQRRGPGGFPWFDCEKPYWWEVPVVMALASPDSFGVVHNAFDQYGMFNGEAWGRPRDRENRADAQGLVDYSLSLYYRYLNLGFRIPPSAGSASGVMPNPPGYNRVYVKLDKPFTVEAWYHALRDGPSFVTNGPMLFFKAAQLPGKEVRVTVDARAREPFERIEIVANGRVVTQFSVPEGKTSFQAQRTIKAGAYTWVAARCSVKSTSSIHMAHSSPVFLAGTWNSRQDAVYFVHWIDELIEQTQRDPKRYDSESERDAVLALYEQARHVFADKVR